VISFDAQDWLFHLDSSMVKVYSTEIKADKFNIFILAVGDDLEFWLHPDFRRLLVYLHRTKTFWNCPEFSLTFHLSHHFITSSFHPSSFNHFIISSFHHFIFLIISSFHHFIISSFHPFITSSTFYSFTISARRFRFLSGPTLGRYAKEKMLEKLFVMKNSSQYRANRFIVIFKCCIYFSLSLFQNFSKYCEILLMPVFLRFIILEINGLAM
jgi:hypothetical protein